MQDIKLGEKPLNSNVHMNMSSRTIVLGQDNDSIGTIEDLPSLKSMIRKEMKKYKAKKQDLRQQDLDLRTLPSISEEEGRSSTIDEGDLDSFMKKVRSDYKTICILKSNNKVSQKLIAKPKL